MSDPQMLMNQMLESIVADRQANPPPAPGERAGALSEYANAVRTAGRDTRAPVEVMQDSMLSSRDPLNPQLAFQDIFRGLDAWKNTQREAEAKREMLATKAQYDDVVNRSKDAFGGSGMMTQLAHAALNPIQNIGGVGVSRLTGETVVPKPLEGVYSRIYTKALEAAVAQQMPNPEEYAKRQANEVIQKHILSNPSIAGSLYTQRPGQAPLPAQGSGEQIIADNAIQTPDGPEVVDQSQPGFSFDVRGLSPEKRELLTRLIARYRANPNPGTEQATSRAIQELLASGELAYDTPPPPLQYRNIPAEKGREKTAEESAKNAADVFNETVIKPAAAAANTSKIMQDFNALGQMQYALKNGKFKEFMAGETGKYALSFLPENSNLRKGIANAQEAEKLTAGMVNQILLMAKGVQTEGDAQRARSQVTSVGTDPEANKYLEAYLTETARQLQLRERLGYELKNKQGTYEGFDAHWRDLPLMKAAKGSVKKLGDKWVGVTQYMEKFKEKNPGATDDDAIQSWNRVKS